MASPGMDVQAFFDALDAKRRYVAERLAADPLPKGRDATRAVRGEIQALGLEGHVADLETDGFTVLPPATVNQPGLVERLRAATERVEAVRPPNTYNRRSGGIEAGAAVGMVTFDMLEEDLAFEEAVLAPAPLALVTYLLGYHAKLGMVLTLTKGQGSAPLPIHADSRCRFPEPWPTYAQMCNATWLLSDYSREEGALCFVPGSHLLGRGPAVEDVPDVVAEREAIHTVEAPAGSVVIWHGNTWHGAHPRTAPGLRRAMVNVFMRQYLITEEPVWLTTSMAVLERNPARFGALAGLADYQPYDRRGPMVPEQRISGIYLHE